MIADDGSVVDSGRDNLAGLLPRTSINGNYFGSGRLQFSAFHSHIYCVAMGGDDEDGAVSVD